MTLWIQGKKWSSCKRRGSNESRPWSWWAGGGGDEDVELYTGGGGDQGGDQGGGSGGGSEEGWVRRGEAGPTGADQMEIHLEGKCWDGLDMRSGWDRRFQRRSPNCTEEQKKKPKKQKIWAAATQFSVCFFDLVATVEHVQFWTLCLRHWTKPRLKNVELMETVVPLMPLWNHKEH